MGLFCLAMAAIPVAGAAGWSRMEPSGATARWMSAYIGAAIGGGGLCLSFVGASALFRRRNARRRMRGNEQTPWLGDHPWNPAGDRELVVGHALRGLLPMLGVAALIAPVNVWVQTAAMPPGTRTPTAVVLGLMDLVLVGGLARSLYHVTRSLKHGPAWVRFARFPFFLGDTLDVQLGCDRGLESLETLTVAVRFIRVRQERSSGETSMVLDQHWGSAIELDARAWSGASGVRLSVPLPAGDYATRLSDDPPRYWELEMKGEGPGVGLHARFLLPVYAREEGPRP
jgi:hypothetical protein